MTTILEPILPRLFKEYIVWKRIRILNPFTKCSRSRERLFLKVGYVPRFFLPDKLYSGFFSFSAILSEKEYMLAILREEI
jgi:hypothetical protein